MFIIYLEIFQQRIMGQVPKRRVKKENIPTSWTLFEILGHYLFRMLFFYWNLIYHSPRNVILKMDYLLGTMYVPQAILETFYLEIRNIYLRPNKQSSFKLTTKSIYTKRAG